MDKMLSSFINFPEMVKSAMNETQKTYNYGLSNQSIVGGFTPVCRTVLRSSKVHVIPGVIRALEMKRQTVPLLCTGETFSNL